ncbi:hypothetical protein BDW22DRAFT_1356972 [Trametopsis cervina]|nr:hypothetical protein BDW22DRAFT_1356972 [Trametopsis cervina]
MQSCPRVARAATKTNPQASRIRAKHSGALSGMRNDLRKLLRQTAQPVAVVTSLMPPPESHNPSHMHSKGKAHEKHARFHGATLSSFSSIAMDPHPLIAFSLRIPSRMATTLKLAHAHYTPSGSSTQTTSNPLANLPTHMVVNILSAHQADIAAQFARPDLYPHPFESVPYRLSEEGLPVLEGALGALSCKLAAASWPLHDLESLKHGRREDREWVGDGVPSELFIGQVVRVESTAVGGGDRIGDEEPKTRTPLLYYQQRYVTVDDVPSSSSSPVSPLHSKSDPPGAKQS